MTCSSVACFGRCISYKWGNSSQAVTAFQSLRAASPRGGSNKTGPKKDCPSGKNKVGTPNPPVSERTSVMPGAECICPFSGPSRPGASPPPPCNKHQIHQFPNGHLLCRWLSAFVRSVVYTDSYTGSAPPPSSRCSYIFRAALAGEDTQ